jgi:hypothetical protein
MVYLSEKELSKQEALTEDRFKKLSSKTNISSKDRPRESLLELTEWVRTQIGEPWDKKKIYECFIHNTINMDGSFMVFCEEQNINTEAIHTDAITSWQTDSEDEHFISVGIFKIIKDDLTFYHCGLFHKGNQNEDEVSFFCLVPKNKREQYLNLRNGFEKWQNKRDRDSKEVEVIGGESFAYDDVSWDDVVLPDELKQSIITSVEGFLGSRELYSKLGVPWKMGLGFWGDAGCGKTSSLRAIISQYDELKPVTIESGHPNPDELLAAAFDYAEEHSPAVLYLEDFQEFVGSTNQRNLLQLLDGVKQRDGILIIVTGNGTDNLAKNLKSRPGRFDKFFEFPLPDVELTKRYLTKFLGDILTSEKLDEIAKKTVEKKLTYAYLKEVYFNSVHIAISKKRDFPIVEDVELSLKQVLSGKTSSENNFEKSKRKVTE